MTTLKEIGRTGTVFTYRRESGPRPASALVILTTTIAVWCRAGREAAEAVPLTRTPCAFRHGMCCPVFTVGVQRNASQEQRAAVASFDIRACPWSDARLRLGSALRRR